MSLLVIVVVLDLGDIFHFFLDNAGVNTHYRGVVVTILSPSAPSVSKTSLLVVLVFLRVGERSLLSGRWLLPTRCVSRSRVGGLIFFGVFLLFLCRLILLETLWVHIADAKKWLEYHFCLCIDGFLNGPFSGVQFPALGIQLGPNKSFQAFPEVLDYNLFIWSGSGVKLLEN